MKENWTKWQRKNRTIFDSDNPLGTFTKYNKYNISLRWYISALSLNIQDTNIMHIGHILKISSTHYIPPTIPSNIKFISFDIPWNDKQMNQTDVYTFIDGSVYYNNDDHDPRSRVYGTGGGAITMYYQHRQIKPWIYPITSRTHINTMELVQSEKVSELMINNTINNIKMKKHQHNIHILSDLQNCSNILKQNTYPKDDVMILTQQRMNKLWNKMSNKAISNKSIHLYTVMTKVNIMMQ